LVSGIVYLLVPTEFGIKKRLSRLLGRGTPENSD